MRLFTLERTEDISGVSGLGTVAEGVVFADGTAVMRWCNAIGSTGIYNSIEDVITIHGHAGASLIRYMGEEQNCEE